MYIIDDTYFQGEISIPNIEESDSRSKTELERLIDEKCRLFLYSVLGSELFDELDTLLVDGILPTTTESKWTKLVYGDTYELDGRQIKWEGICSILGTSKSSLLADYVYTFFLTESNTFLSGVGEMKSNASGTIMVNSTQRYINIWNRFLEKYQFDLLGNIFDFRNYFFNYQFSYPRYESTTNKSVSLVQYLTDNSEDFPNLSLPYFEVKNQLGL
jgi:hypothetical protein